MKILLTRLALVLLLIAISAGTAYLVARNTGGATGSGLDTATQPPIQTSDRELVSLSEQTIMPIYSSDGTVVQQEDGKSWMIESPITPQTLAYRYISAPVGVKGRIGGGPAGFDCAWIGLGQAADGSVTMQCAIPADITVVAGLPATMVVQLSEPITAMALPITAVLGSAEQGQVVVVHDDGTTEVRAIQIGATDSFWVEVTGGLTEGESVLAVPVETDFHTNTP
ncbi:MAG: efflux RND transporter periplasmic adaptor subunit [Thermomicrobiales bacterium]|nr:efflux RND transporter periplasmic adaptor subunit [Thermomicrobiales bacterium]